MSYIIPIKERDRFHRHGILFVPLTKIINNVVDVSEVIESSFDIWAKGNSWDIIFSNKQPRPLKGFVHVPENTGFLSFGKGPHQDYLGSFYVRMNLIDVYRVFR